MKTTTYSMGSHTIYETLLCWRYFLFVCVFNNYFMKSYHFKMSLIKVSGVLTDWITSKIALIEEEVWDLGASSIVKISNKSLDLTWIKDGEDTYFINTTDNTCAYNKVNYNRVHQRSGLLLNLFKKFITCLILAKIV